MQAITSVSARRPKPGQDIPDVIVIGGGVVGCAVTRRFALRGAKVVLLERGGDILTGASKANSAILHTGFDAPPDSLELACIKAGYREFMEIGARMNLPVLRTGALVVAWNEEQMNALDRIVAQARENAVADVGRISGAELLAREPGLAGSALGAVEIPGEMVIDPWSTPLAYLKQAVTAGAQARFNIAVTGGDFDGKNWRLETSQGPFAARIVVNCTGTDGDITEAICRVPDFEIRPRKGQFLVYDKSAAALIRAIILPVPSPTTKGVVLTRTIFGNLLLGPTAEEQRDRHQARVSRAGLAALIETGAGMLPGLVHHPVTATYAGLRPATQFKDYRIEAVAGKNWIGVNGIRSTGLTGALGIAAHVERLCARSFPGLLARREVRVGWPHMPMLAEHRPRAWQKGDGSEIVCHCERVTRAEIEAALEDPLLPARTLGGLRRRTRAMMGRCNGFYCSARIARLSAGRIAPALARPLAEPGS